MTSRNIKTSDKLSRHDSDTTKKDLPSLEAPLLPQSGALVPLEYDSLLAFVLGKNERRQHDPLTALLPIFMHVAFSEVQLLNLIADQISIETDPLKKDDGEEAALYNLRYLSTVLDRHAQQTEAALQMIRNLMALSGHNDDTAPQQQKLKPRPDSWSQTFLNMKGAFTAAGLLCDYEEMLVQARRLSEQCTTAMSVMMNRTLIQESRNAIAQSRRMKKLTILATLFIPLGFSSSLFSMDLDLFEKNGRKLWWYFAVCVPITGLAYAFYLWDTAAVRRASRRALRRLMRHISTDDTHATSI